MTGNETQRNTSSQRAWEQISHLVDRAVLAWDRLRQAVLQLAGEVIEEILFFLEPDAETPGESAATHREQTAAAIIELLGQDPARTLLALSPREREIAVAELHIAIARALGIEPPCTVSSSDMSGVAGFYSFAKDTIVLNAGSLSKQPMTLLEAKTLLDTVCHETYHAMQRRALRSPSKYGVSKAEAKIWRINFKNYIEPEQNPERYMFQPVEITAYNFASAVIREIYGKG